MLGKLNSGGLRANLVKEASGTFVVKASNTVTSMLISVVLARMLGSEGFGVYAFAMAIIYLLVQLSSCGLPPLMVREVAAGKSRKDWGLIHGLLRWCSSLSFFVSIGFMLLATTTTWLLSERLDEQVFVIYLALSSLPFQVFIRLHSAVLRGLRRIALSQLSMRMVRPWLFLLLLGSFYLWQENEISAANAMGLHVTAFFGAWLTGWVLMRRHLPHAVMDAQPVYHSGKWWGSARHFLLVASVGMLYDKTDIIMLGIITDAEQVGAYRVAQRGAELILFLPMIAAYTVGPTISKFKAEDKMEKLQRLATTTSRVMFLFSLPIAFAFIFFGHWIISFVFGRDFVAAVIPLAILCIAWLVASGTGVCTELLNMTGNERYNARAMTISAGTNVVLNAILIPLLGIEGAAIATASSILLSVVLLTIWTTSRTGIHPTILGCPKRKK